MIPIVFFGTNNFAETILEAIIKSGLFDVRLVITQPDRPVGRHQKIEKCPVKVLAEKNGLKLFQPESLKNVQYPISNIQLNIVVEYGLIIPQAILDGAAHGSINIHPSLLPKYRGPSPIQSVLINGEKETGVSIMLMDKKMDHGPILMQKIAPISSDDTYLSLAEKLSHLSAELLLETIPKYIDGSIKPQVQNDSEATFCKILQKEDGRVDFGKSAEEIYNQFRGMMAWPGIFAMLEEKRIKFLNIKPSELNVPSGVLKIIDGRAYVGCKNGSIEILEAQVEGKKPMHAAEFINGYKKFDGFEMT